MKPFEQVWSVAKKIPSHVTREECEALYKAACKVPDGLNILEVGAYRGRSTYVLAASGHRIVTIDSMILGEHPGNRMKVTEEDVEALRSLVDSLPNVDWIRSHTKDVHLDDTKVGMLFIDADHRYPAARSDFVHFRNNLVPRAPVFFHDFAMFSGVTRSVNDLVCVDFVSPCEAYGTMLETVSRSWQDPCIIDELDADGVGATVRGFSLFVLCHNFGVRGRVFASSLANQVDTYPIHLTVFYDREKDREFLEEGAASGKNALPVRYVKIPEDRIMYRPKHFAAAEPAPDTSHTVYTDCDLWFPPWFFHRYAKALSCRKPGYWSCRTMNVPLKTVEESLNDWRSIDEERLRGAVDKGRGAIYLGRIGVFQCVPNGFMKYLDRDIASVGGVDLLFSNAAVDASADKRRERRIGLDCAYHLDHARRWEGVHIQM